MVLKYFIFILAALFSITSYAEPVKTRSIVTITPPADLPGTIYGELSLSSWQDGLTLNTAGQASSHLLQTTTAFCPGVGYRKPLSRDVAWDINGCGFYGISEINNDSTGSSITNYSSKNNSVYGVESAFGFLFSPGGIKHQLGIEIPVLYRHSNPSAAGAGTSFSSTNAVQTGIELDTRFYSAKGFCVDPKLAWFQTTHTMLWSLNFGMDL